MVSGGKKDFRRAFLKWCDDWALSVRGILLATKSPRFWAFFVPVFLIFGTLLNLLSGGTAAFSLIGASDFGGALKIIFDGLLGLFGIGKNFLDWLLVFSAALLQATLIGAIAVIWKHNKETSDLQNSGIVAGLAILGSGCPTCGTALLTPIIGAIFSGGSVAIAGVLSGVVTAAAIIVAVLTLRKVGLDVYAIIISKKVKEKNGKG